MALEGRATGQALFGRTLPRPGAGKTPVTVMTGFLGAGKTTILRTLLKRPQAARSVIIVNEYGDIGIDDALLSNDGQNTILLGNGCICCKVLTDLQQTCLDLLRDRASGAIPSFDRIIIETSGLADPVPILQTFMTERGLGGQLHLRGLVAAVDASNFKDPIGRFSECRRQLIFADRVVVTKSDLVSPSQREDVRQAVAAISPNAKIQVASGDIDPDFLLEERDYAPQSHFYAEPVHSDTIETFSFTLVGPINWDAFSQTLNLLSKLRGSDVLRIKGFLNVQGCNGPVVVQVVQHVAYPAEELQSWPSDDRQSRLVCIVRNIDRDHVVLLFEAAQSIAR